MFHVTYYSYPQSFHVTRKRLFWIIFGRFWALKCHFRLYFERVSYRFPLLPYVNSAVNFCGYFLWFLQFFQKINFGLFFSLFTFILGCFVGIMVLITVVFLKKESLWNVFSAKTWKMRKTLGTAQAVMRRFAARVCADLSAEIAILCLNFCNNFWFCQEKSLILHPLLDAISHEIIIVHFCILFLSHQWFGSEKIDTFPMSDYRHWAQSFLKDPQRQHWKRQICHQRKQGSFVASNQSVSWLQW